MLASPPCERLEQARTAKFARYYRNNIFLPLLSSPIRACFFWFFCFASRASDFVVVVWEQIFLPVITPKANTILNHAKYHRIAVLILNCSQPYYSFIYSFTYLFIYLLFIYRWHYLVIGEKKSQHWKVTARAESESRRASTAKTLVTFSHSKILGKCTTMVGHTNAWK